MNRMGTFTMLYVISDASPFSKFIPQIKRLIHALVLTAHTVRIMY